LPPGRIVSLVDDVTHVVDTAGMTRLSSRLPRFARLTALPRTRREAKNIDVHGTALHRSGQQLGNPRGDNDGMAAH